MATIEYIPEETTVSPSGRNYVPPEDPRPTISPAGRSYQQIIRYSAKPQAGTPKEILFGAIPDRGLRCKKAIRLRISREGSSTFAHSPELGEFGYGNNISEALDDFGGTVAELYRSLERDESRLGKDLQQQLVLLRKFLENRPAK